MDGSIKMILALAAVVVIGGFVIYAMWPSRKSPRSEGTSEDTNLVSSATVYPESGHSGSSHDGHSAP